MTKLKLVNIIGHLDNTNLSVLWNEQSKSVELETYSSTEGVAQTTIIALTINEAKQLVKLIHEAMERKK